LGDLFSSEQPKKTSTKPKKQYQDKPKQQGNDDLKKPGFYNNTGVKNKDLMGQNQNSNYSKNYEQPKFTNSKGTTKSKNPADDFHSEPNVSGFDQKERRKFENSKPSQGHKDTQKPPTKDYLEADQDSKYKSEDVQIEKPKFTNTKKGDANFVDYNKNEDLYLKNLNEKKDFQIENIYSEPKENREHQTKEKKEKPHYKNNQNYQKGDRDKEEKAEEQKETKYEVDSDGFEIVGQEVKKPKTHYEQHHYKEKKHNYEKKEKKPFVRNKENQQPRKPSEHKEESDKEEKAEKIVEEKPKEPKKETFKVNPEHKKLGDLFK